MTRQIGIILLIGVLCALLAAMLFPVFAQAKEAAKKTSEESEFRQRVLQADTQVDAPMHTAARQPGAERSAVRNATLAVEVDNLERAEAKMKGSVTARGGYIDHEEGMDLASQTPVLQLTIRIPEKSFDDVLAGFEALGRRTQKSISASDLTEQILDAEAQLKQAEGQVKPAVEQVAQFRAQRDELLAKAAMSSIDLTLAQRPDVGLAAAANTSWGSDTWNSAASSAMDAYRFVGTIGIWLLVYSPLWLVPCLIAFAIHRHWKRGPGLVA